MIFKQLQLFSGIRARVGMLGHVLSRLTVLRRPPVTEEFYRQILFTGTSAAGSMVIRGAFIGTLLIAYVINVLEADVTLAVKILLMVVMREFGPLLAAILVIQRSGTAIATNLSLMHISGEIDCLRQLRIDPYDLLVVPRVVGMALSLAVLTFYVQVIAVGGGIFLSALMIDVSVEELADNFFRFVSIRDITYSVLKSLLFGSAIALISCYHGLNPSDNSINAVPKAAVNAVMESTLAVMTLNAVFAYLAFGLLFFGLIRAQA
ncbi:MAG: ABC transporter permease [Betaproteobacteria bacterium]|nr:ABC transporter permease [Betaproteobacteria bacterium]